MILLRAALSRPPKKGAAEAWQARATRAVDPVVQISLFVKLKLAKCVRRAQSLYCAAPRTLLLRTRGTTDWRNKAIAPYDRVVAGLHRLPQPRLLAFFSCN